MALSGRNVFRICLFVVAGGFLACHEFRTPPQEAPATAPAAAVAAPQRPAKAQTWKLGNLTLTACELGQPNSGLSTAAWCAAFPVPENRDDPHSRIIHLKMAVLRTRAQLASG